MAVRNILSKQDLPISDAVKEFMRPFNDAVDSGDGAVEESLWQSWSDLIKYSATIPHSEQGRLVQFMQELRKEQSPKKQNEESCKIWGETLEWKTLPLFGPSLRESWNNDGSESGDREGWVNQNAFAARMTALSQPYDPFDFSLYGVWALRSALEDPAPESEPPSDSVFEAAAVWMLHAARTLKERSRDEQTYDGKIAREGESLKGKGWRGFCQERWDIWGERMKSAEETCKSNDTRALLKEANRKMREA